MSDVNLLRAYKLQNPRKYQLKFGDKSPEEVVLKDSPPMNLGSVTVDMGEKKAVEMEFQDTPQLLTKDDVVPESLPALTLSEDGTQFVPEVDDVSGTEIKPKRGRPRNMLNPLTGQTVPNLYQVEIFIGKNKVLSQRIRTTNEEEAVAQVAKSLKTKVKQLHEQTEL